MENAERAVDFYRRTAGRYLRRRPHGLREWVLERQRRRVIELARPRADDRVLDVGCGAGKISALLRPRVRTIYGVDACAPLLRLAAPSLDVSIEGRIETLRLEATFDLVLCCGVLEFVEDAVGALAAVRDHLAPDGRAVVSAPALSPCGLAYALVRRAQRLKVRLYTRARFRRLAHVCGLRCTELLPLPGGALAAVLER